MYQMNRSYLDLPDAGEEQVDVIYVVYLVQEQGQTFHECHSVVLQECIEVNTMLSTGDKRLAIVGAVMTVM